MIISPTWFIAVVTGYLRRIWWTIACKMTSLIATVTDKNKRKAIHRICCSMKRESQLFLPTNTTGSIVRWSAITTSSASWTAYKRKSFSKNLSKWQWERSRILKIDYLSFEDNNWPYDPPRPPYEPPPPYEPININSRTGMSEFRPVQTSCTTISSTTST